ncbi:hypothetical protein EC973_002191 [Apophysomyces ossiformis]|uniref:Stromal membrane-associated protein n=1 Tax=Apophysomyces ossiformis TaxID=679940 RepID=A0A8H7BU91_9FUNG|nr:hypothetical protein EC973_002191 [Apophysomyces ossiformis]
MIKWGNERANKYWEANLNDRKPTESNMEMWIRAKYEQKRWAMKGPIPDPSTLGAEEVPTVAKPASPPPAQSSTISATSTPKRPEFGNLDDFLGSPSSKPQQSAASKLQGADFFFDNTVTSNNKTRNATATNASSATIPKSEKPPHDDFKSSILSLYSQTPSNPSVSSMPTGGYVNNMANYHQQLSGLTMGMPSSGVIPQAPAGQAAMYQNVWNNFGNAPTGNGAGFGSSLGQPQQPVNNLPQGSQFFSMNNQAADKKPAYEPGSAIPDAFNMLQVLS